MESHDVGGREAVVGREVARLIRETVRAERARIAHLLRLMAALAEQRPRPTDPAQVLRDLADVIEQES